MQKEKLFICIEASKIYSVLYNLIWKEYNRVDRYIVLSRMINISMYG